MSNTTQTPSILRLGAAITCRSRKSIALETQAIYHDGNHFATLQASVKNGVAQFEIVEEHRSDELPEIYAIHEDYANQIFDTYEEAIEAVEENVRKIVAKQNAAIAS